MRPVNVYSTVLSHKGLNLHLQVSQKFIRLLTHYLQIIHKFCRNFYFYIMCYLRYFFFVYWLVILLILLLFLKDTLDMFYETKWLASDPIQTLSILTDSTCCWSSYLIFINIVICFLSGYIASLVLLFSTFMFAEISPLMYNTSTGKEKKVFKYVFCWCIGIYTSVLAKLNEIKSFT